MEQYFAVISRIQKNYLRDTYSIISVHITLHFINYRSSRLILVWLFLEIVPFPFKIPLFLLVSVRHRQRFHHKLI
jgi:hypothetical protein